MERNVVNIKIRSSANSTQVDGSVAEDSLQPLQIKQSRRQFAQAVVVEVTATMMRTQRMRIAIGNGHASLLPISKCQELHER